MKATAESIREKAEKEIVKMEREEKIAGTLPFAAHSVYWHDSPCEGHAVVKLSPRSLAEAVTLYETAINVVPLEAWQDSCLSVAPLGANYTAQRGNGPTENGAAHEFTAEFSLELDSYGDRGEYQITTLSYWIVTHEAGETLCEIRVPISDAWNLLPSRTVNYNRGGEVSNFHLTPKSLGEKKRINWWSTRPGYKISYYFDFVPDSLRSTGR
jgi:hypothetical protein